MKVKRVLCSIINQKWKDSSLNPQPLFTVAWHGRHENGPEWDNPDVQVQTSFPDQVPRSWKNKISYFFSDTETSDKGSVKKKKTSRVSSTGTTGLRDLVSKSFVIFKSSALMESSWTTLARISEALTAALSGGFSSSFLLILYFPVQFDKYFIQVPHCLQKSFESDRKYWHSCCLWYQVYCKRKKNCFGILQGLSI